MEVHRPAKLPPVLTGEFRRDRVLKGESHRRSQRASRPSYAPSAVQRSEESIFSVGFWKDALELKVFVAIERRAASRARRGILSLAKLRREFMRKGKQGELVFFLYMLDWK